MSDIMYFDPKAEQKIWSKGGDCNKLYVPKLKAISLWFFYRKVTGINPTIVKKVSDIIEDNPEAPEATMEAALAQNSKGNNLELNMEVAIPVG